MNPYQPGHCTLTYTFFTICHMSNVYNTQSTPNWWREAIQLTGEGVKINIFFKLLIVKLKVAYVVKFHAGYVSNLEKSKS